MILPWHAQSPYREVWEPPQVLPLSQTPVEWVGSWEDLGKFSAFLGDMCAEHEVTLVVPMVPLGNCFLKWLKLIWQIIENWLPLNVHGQLLVGSEECQRSNGRGL